MYKLPENLNDALHKIYGDELVVTIKDTLRMLSELNDIFLNNVDFNFSLLEEKLMDTVFENDEEEDELPALVADVLFEMFTNYLKEYGILVNEEKIKLNTLLKIIDVLHNMFTVDNNLMEEYLDDVEENLDKDEEEQFASIVAEKSDLSFGEVYESLEYVSKDFYKMFINFYNKEISSRTIKLNTKIMKLIEDLNNIDAKYLNTYIIKYITKYGYTPSNFESLEDTMYKVIQSSDTTSYEDIAREILMFLYIAEDTRGKKIDIFPDFINLNWADDLFKDPTGPNKAGSIQINEAYIKMRDILYIRTGHDI